MRTYVLGSGVVVAKIETPPTTPTLSWSGETVKSICARSMSYAVGASQALAPGDGISR